MRKFSQTLIHIALIVLIGVGVFLRFYRIDWNQGANLHPDEYGLTNTLFQLQMPRSSEEYFNTRLSPLSPYPRYDQNGQPIANGPDHGMRWGQLPQILIRWMAEATGNTGYDELRLLGRKLSALADILSLWLLYQIGARLYSNKTGLLAACLSALAVMQIQQSHFMTVDNFATLFTMIAFYAAVRIAQKPGLRRQLTQPANDSSAYRPDLEVLSWHLVFGIALGMALASKINLLPLAGMILPAGFLSIADLKLKAQQDLKRIGLTWAAFLGAAAFMTMLTFRLCQPMSFRNPVGDTSFFTLYPNPDWIRNMQWAQNESNGIGGGPPGEQWAHRPAIIFPWVNMVLWGMGLPLGLMSWASFAWAAWQSLRGRQAWRSHLLPLLWTGGYFFFMGTRWVKSIRYFLPIYPFLALLAAWGLLELWKLANQSRATNVEASRKPGWKRQGVFKAIAALTTMAVMLGSLTWAVAFVQAVYREDHTRIRATRWILDHAPAPFHLSLVSEEGHIGYSPVEAPDGLMLTSGQFYIRSFQPALTGKLQNVTIPHLTTLSGNGKLHIRISIDPEGQSMLDEAEIPLDPAMPPGSDVQAAFRGARLMNGITYYLTAFVEGDGTSMLINRTVIATETWDESLPLNYGNVAPYRQFYRGIQMQVRWYDDENKRQMFLESLAQADYIILPSQRAIWSSCRIPRTYPMTMAYYRALFNGELGFDLAASFSTPIKLGPLQISDVGGALAWKRPPTLPLFNNSLLAAEEAFSVYDHPPVWIFEKRSDYNQDQVAQFFYAIDLSQVVVEGPREASLPPCR